LAVISVTDNGSEGASISGEQPSRNPDLDVALSDAERNTARNALTRSVGQPLGPRSVVRLARGSSAVASSDLGLCPGGGGNDAVLRADGDALEVYRRYVAQLPREAGPVTTSVGRFNGKRAREAVTDWGSVRLVERKGGAVLAVSECSG
jgi:hypothetical protein